MMIANQTMLLISKKLAVSENHVLSSKTCVVAANSFA